MDSYLKENSELALTFSDVKKQEEDISLGSILSITLFNIKINNIIKELPFGIDASLYVNNLICFKSKYIHTIESKLKQGLKKISRWATVNGYEFTKTKTKCVHFCHSPPAKKKKHYIITPA